MRDVCFLPLDDSNLDGISGLTFAPPSESSFQYLLSSLLSLLAEFSVHGDLVYVKTAVLLQKGVVKFGPANLWSTVARLKFKEIEGGPRWSMFNYSDDFPINLALTKFGIKLSSAIKIAPCMRLRSPTLRHLLKRCRVPYPPLTNLKQSSWIIVEAKFCATRPQGIS